MSGERGALSAALYAVLKAIARLCLKHGYPYDAFAELGKQAFVDVAYSEFTIPKRKQSASRVSLLTGIHRKEIARMRSADEPEGSGIERIAHSAAVITGWRRDKRFTDARTKPATLHFEGRPNSFSDLVREYGGGDVPPRAVLDELVRVKAVKLHKDGRIKLVVDAYVPMTTSAEAFAIFGSDVSDLISTIAHNLNPERQRGYFQRKVAYDNLSAEAIEEILTKAERDGQALLEKMDRTMARRDRDANPNAKGSGRKRAMVGVYCFTEDVSED